MADRKGCFTCHGPGGIRGMANPGHGLDEVPPFSGGLITMYAQSEGEIREWILDGLPRRIRDDPEQMTLRANAVIHMPAWRGLLSARETDDLVAFVKAMSDFEVPQDAKASEGREVAKRLGCFNCHGPQGRGSMPNVRSFKGYIPSWDGADFPELARSDAEVREWILDGRPRRLQDEPRRALLPRPAADQDAGLSRTCRAGRGGPPRRLHQLGPCASLLSGGATQLPYPRPQLHRARLLDVVSAVLEGQHACVRQRRRQLLRDGRLDHVIVARVGHEGRRQRRRAPPRAAGRSPPRRGRETAARTRRRPSRRRRGTGGGGTRRGPRAGAASGGRARRARGRPRRRSEAARPGRGAGAGPRLASSTRCDTRAGCSAARTRAVPPPIECPSTAKRSSRSASARARTTRPRPRSVARASATGALPPKPGRSTRMTRNAGVSCGAR